MMDGSRPTITLPNGRCDALLSEHRTRYSPDPTTAGSGRQLSATIALFWRVSRPAAVLLLPYVTWVTFASGLTYAIWALNQQLLQALSQLTQAPVPGAARYSWHPLGPLSEAG